MTRLTRLAEATKRTVSTLALVLLVPAIVVLFGIALVTTIDVLLRLILNHPLTGVADGTKLMMVALCWLGAAWVMVKERHIAVDLVVSRFRPRSQLIIEAVNSILGLGFFVIIVWAGTSYAIRALHIKDSTLETLTVVPAYPFRFAIVAGASLLLIVLVIRFVDHINKAVKGMGGPNLEETSHDNEAKP